MANWRFRAHSLNGETSLWRQRAAQLVEYFPLGKTKCRTREKFRLCKAKIITDANPANGNDDKEGEAERQRRRQEDTGGASYAERES